MDIEATLDSVFGDCECCANDREEYRLVLQEMVNFGAIIERAEADAERGIALEFDKHYITED